MSDMLNYQPGSDPKSAVKGPAFGLMAVGVIGVLWQVAMLLMNVLGVGLNAIGGGRQGMVNMLSGGVGIVFSIVGILVGGVILFGALKMQKLQNYNLAMGASIVAMIPCISPCCLLGLPFGIWALVVLLKPEVKGAFTSK